jgi:hypothetical protein
MLIEPPKDGCGVRRDDHLFGVTAQSAGRRNPKFWGSAERSAENLDPLGATTTDRSIARGDPSGWFSPGAKKARLCDAKLLMERARHDDFHVTPRLHIELCGQRYSLSSPKARTSTWEAREKALVK